MSNYAIVVAQILALLDGVCSGMINYWPKLAREFYHKVTKSGLHFRQHWPISAHLLKARSIVAEMFIGFVKFCL